MVTTHIFVSLLLAFCVSFVSPLEVGTILPIAFVGGFFPDLDMFFGTHRKTLHYPVYGSVLAVASFVFFLITHSMIIGFITIFLIGCMSHTLTDILSCGLEKYPWKKNSKQAVYNHHTKKWIPPRYIIPYDGSIEDFGVTFIGGVLFLFATKTYTINYYLWMTMGLIGVAFIYTVLRKRLPRIEQKLYSRFPLLDGILD
jgi:hypothetical protein